MEPLSIVLVARLAWRCVILNCSLWDSVAVDLLIKTHTAAAFRAMSGGCVIGDPAYDL